MPRLAIAGVDLHYRIDGAGPPLVLLHGAGGHSLSWFQQIPVLSAHFTCVAVDYPGFGLSSWSGASSTMTDVLVRLVDHFGWTRVAIVAHSMGGWAALRFGLSATPRLAAAVFSSTWAGLRLPDVLRALDEREARLRSQQELWRARAPGSFLAGAGERMAREQPALHWLAAGISAINRGAGPAVWDRDDPYNALLMPETEAAEIREWRIPTLFLTGDEDVVVPPAAVERVAQALGGSVSVSKQTGHSIYLERPDWFNEAVLNFMREHYKHE